MVHVHSLVPDKTAIDAASAMHWADRVALGCIMVHACYVSSPESD